MSSREKVLASIQKNQPLKVEMSVLNFASRASVDVKEQFIKTLTGIGGSVKEANDWKEVALQIKSAFPKPARIINTVSDLIPEFEILITPAAQAGTKSDPHDFSNVNVSIIQGEFGVAENGAIWLTDSNMGNQALPYISEHLILIIKRDQIVPTLHEAYERIGTSKYALGTFLAGPSKTADIEQSLVLGAHGSKSLIAFLIP